MTTTAEKVAQPTDTADDESLLMTVAEVADDLRLKPWAVYQLCKSGELPGIYLGHKSLRIKRVDLIAFIDSRPAYRPEPEKSSDDAGTSQTGTA